MKSKAILNYGLLPRVLLLMLSMGILAGCTKSSTTDNAGPGTNEVWMQNYAFVPSTITVSSGTTVTWTNKDGVDHTVTSDTGLFDSGNITGNSTFSHTFNTPGTYAYHCTIHTYMTGKVIVN